MSKTDFTGWVCHDEKDYKNGTMKWEEIKVKEWK